MADKKKQKKKPEKAKEKKTETSEEENKYGGFPDVDFKKHLGCGG